MPDWNPRSTNASPRAGPAVLRPGRPGRADAPLRPRVDLGCGTGELTAAGGRAARGAPTMVGIDNSPAMLADAASHDAAERRASSVGDIGRWTAPAITTWCSRTPPCSGCPTTPRCWRGGPRRWRPAGSSPCRCRPTPTMPSHLADRRGGAHRAVPLGVRTASRRPTRWPSTCSRPEAVRRAAVRPRLRRAARAAAGVPARAAVDRRTSSSGCAAPR